MRYPAVMSGSNGRMGAAAGRWAPANAAGIASVSAPSVALQPASLTCDSLAPNGLASDDLSLTGSTPRISSLTPKGSLSIPGPVLIPCVQPETYAGFDVRRREVFIQSRSLRYHFAFAACSIGPSWTHTHAEPRFGGRLRAQVSERAVLRVQAHSVWTFTLECACAEHRQSLLPALRAALMRDGEEGGDNIDTQNKAGRGSLKSPDGDRPCLRTLLSLFRSSLKKNLALPYDLPSGHEDASDLSPSSSLESVLQRNTSLFVQQLVRDDLSYVRALAYNALQLAMGGQGPSSIQDVINLAQKSLFTFCRSNTSLPTSPTPAHEHDTDVARPTNLEVLCDSVLDAAKALAIRNSPCFGAVVQWSAEPVVLRSMVFVRRCKPLIYSENTKIPENDTHSQTAGLHEIDPPSGPRLSQKGRWQAALTAELLTQLLPSARMVEKIVFGNETIDVETAQILRNAYALTKDRTECMVAAQSYPLLADSFLPYPRYACNSAGGRGDKGATGGIGGCESGSGLVHQLLRDDSERSQKARSVLRSALLGVGLLTSDVRANDGMGGKGMGGKGMGGKERDESLSSAFFGPSFMREKTNNPASLCGSAILNCESGKDFLVGPSQQAVLEKFLFPPFKSALASMKILGVNLGAAPATCSQLTQGSKHVVAVTGPNLMRFTVLERFPPFFWARAQVPHGAVFLQLLTKDGSDGLIISDFAATLSAYPRPTFSPKLRDAINVPPSTHSLLSSELLDPSSTTSPTHGLGRGGAGGSVGAASRRGMWHAPGARTGDIPIDRTIVLVRNGHNERGGGKDLGLTLIGEAQIRATASALAKLLNDKALGLARDHRSYSVSGLRTERSTVDKALDDSVRILEEVFERENSTAEHHPMRPEHRQESTETLFPDQVFGRAGETSAADTQVVLADDFHLLKYFGQCFGLESSLLLSLANFWPHAAFLLIRISSASDAYLPLFGQCSHIPPALLTFNDDGLPPRPLPSSGVTAHGNAVASPCTGGSAPYSSPIDQSVWRLREQLELLWPPDAAEQAYSINEPKSGPKMDGLSDKLTLKTEYSGRTLIAREGDAFEKDTTLENNLRERKAETSSSEASDSDSEDPDAQDPSQGDVDFKGAATSTSKLQAESLHRKTPQDSDDGAPNAAWEPSSSETFPVVGAKGAAGATSNANTSMAPKISRRGSFSSELSSSSSSPSASHASSSSSSSDGVGGQSPSGEQGGVRDGGQGGGQDGVVQQQIPEEIFTKERLRELAGRCEGTVHCAARFPSPSHSLRSRHALRSRGSSGSSHSHSHSHSSSSQSPRSRSIISFPGSSRRGGGQSHDRTLDDARSSGKWSTGSIRSRDAPRTVGLKPKLPEIYDETAEDTTDSCREEVRKPRTPSRLEVPKRVRR